MTSPDSSTRASAAGPRPKPPASSSASSPAPGEPHVASPTPAPSTSPWNGSGHPTPEQYGAALLEALSTLAEKMGAMGFGAEHLTCSETEALCRVLALSGHFDSADRLRDAHAGGDTEYDDQHHGRWHALNEHDPDTIAACCGNDGGDDLTEAIKEGRR